MQVQQLSDLNVSGGKQLEANKSSRSAGIDARDSQQDNAFKEQLNKQIDQSKTPVNEENSQVNHDDSVEAKNDNLNSEEPVSATDAEPAIASESQPGNEDTQADIEDVTAIENVLTETVLKPDTLPVTVENAETLPEHGNPLPLSPAPVQATVVAAENAKNAEKTTATPVGQLKGIDVTEKTTQNLQKPVDIVASSAKTQTQANTEVAAAPAAYKAVNATERLINTQSGKMAPVMSEMPAAEVVTQSTRLQQVALATAISASTPTAQNVNAVTNNFSSEINTAVTSTGNQLTNSLSSTITTQLQSPQWSQKMTEQVSFMLKGGFQQAEIKLNPAHLGPMEIKLTMNDDQATVSFVAQHAPVREALDSAIPRLREMLEQQGINLADVDVSSKSQQQANDGDGGKAQGAGSGDEDQDVSADQANIKNVVANIEIDSGVSIYA